MISNGAMVRSSHTRCCLGGFTHGQVVFCDGFGDIGLNIAEVYFR